MELKLYISERIKLNNLPIDVDNAYMTVKLYADIYPDMTEFERFFQYILNEISQHLVEIDEEIAEILGFLSVHKAKNSDIVYYKFLTQEDYLDWLHYRIKLYNGLSKDNIRLLNFVELSTLDFISDIITNQKYELFNNKQKFIVNKTEFSNDKDTKISFIKYLGNQYKNNYSFKPI